MQEMCKKGTPRVVVPRDSIIDISAANPAYHQHYQGERWTSLASRVAATHIVVEDSPGSAVDTSTYSCQRTHHRPSDPSAADSPLQHAAASAAEAAWATADDVVAVVVERIAKHGEIAIVAMVAAEALATFDSKDSHRTTESGAERSLACSGASAGSVAWLFASVALETPSDSVDLGSLGNLGGSSVRQDASFVLDMLGLGCYLRPPVENGDAEALL